MKRVPFLCASNARPTWHRLAIFAALSLSVPLRVCWGSIVDDVVATEMKDHGIRGVSVAIIENGEISKAKGYGFTDKTATIPVTTNTIFQAGSISKPVAALAALRLVEDGRLTLDGDVNRWMDLAATGYYANGNAVDGNWHVYPEMAAAGLWTTASDLARFAVGVQDALAGKSNPVISKAMTREMLTAQKGSSGLGAGLDGSGKSLRFFHGGRDEGFDALMVAWAESGQGVVVMINANDDSGALNRIVEAVSKEYHWPEGQRTTK